MSDETAEPEDGEEDGAKKGGKGMIVGLGLAVVLGGGGFFAAYSGMVPGLGGGEPILDVLNTYLRAVELRDVENPAAMTRLRAQMLRRVNIVTGEGRVNDLLITEFVLKPQ